MGKLVLVPNPDYVDPGYIITEVEDIYPFVVRLPGTTLLAEFMSRERAEAFVKEKSFMWVIQ